MEIVMSKPDGAVSINALSVAVPAGFIIFILTLFIFNIKESISYFSAVLWVGLPVVAYLIAAGMNVASQYMYCSNTDSGKAFLGAVPSLIAAWIGIGISSITFCRIPVASVFSPFFIKDSSNNQANGITNSVKNAACCKPPPSLESLEGSNPLLTGLSYGFYLFFSMLFGIVLGSGTAVVC
jgi:hypothetical protein